MRIHAAYSPIAEDVCRMYEAAKPDKPPVRLVG